MGKLKFLILDLAPNIWIIHVPENYNKKSLMMYSWEEKMQFTIT